MIFTTTLLAGQTNVLNKVGRYFYLLSSPDVVRIRFRDGAKHSTDFETDMREGMSADFPIEITEITLESKTAQRIEFWLGNTKLDYSMLAAGGASSFVNSGHAICGLGSNLAIDRHFRRKSITLTASADIVIGGLDVNANNGYSLKAGEPLTLGTRGAIHAYVKPAKIDMVSNQTSRTGVPATGRDDDYFHNDESSCFFHDKTTGNLITGNGRLVYSQDDGRTWLDSQVAPLFGKDSMEVYQQFGQTPNGIFVFRPHLSRIGVSRDGGETFDYFASLQGSLDIHGQVINDGLHVFSGWISADEQNLLFAAEERIWQSFDAGQTWEALPRNGANSVVHKTSTGDIYSITERNVYKLLNNQWMEIALSGGDSGHSLVSTGNKLYWFDANRGVLLHTHDGGQSWHELTTSRQEARFAKYMIKVGNSVVLGGLNWLGVIENFGGELTWYESNLASGAQYAGDRLVFDGQNIIVRQIEDRQNTVPISIVWPVAISVGAIFDVPLQWLAENN
ncbi:WD40/YVTN/BNR-like repeat-containing protein [Shewanella sp. YLB-07]|uniref:WD40/YVTN/BNR-like repeat-containing protein n=1 Tax=Shewanella sp. YLB-07 TaxID=2601268 RepID=UPI00128BE079|nr:hypothetical protein [Shewanella sp. YLB-07]MPY23922.1 hypothetical protein [Shewanella sp. YLB-07]